MTAQKRLNPGKHKNWDGGRGQLKCDDTRTDTRFRLSAERTSPFKSAGASVQSTTGSRGVRISGSSAGYTMFRGSVKSTDYPLHSPVSPSIPLPCVTVCHHISAGVYKQVVRQLYFDSSIAARSYLTATLTAWRHVKRRCFFFGDLVSMAKLDRTYVFIWYVRYFCSLITEFGSFSTDVNGCFQYLISWKFVKSEAR